MDEVTHLRQRVVDAREALFVAIRDYELRPGQKDAARRIDDAIALIDQLQQQLDEVEELEQLGPKIQALR